MGTDIGRESDRFLLAAVTWAEETYGKRLLNSQVKQESNLDEAKSASTSTTIANRFSQECEQSLNVGPASEYS